MRKFVWVQTEANQSSSPSLNLCHPIKMCKLRQIKVYKKVTIVTIDTRRVGPTDNPPPTNFQTWSEKKKERQKSCLIFDM